MTHVLQVNAGETREINEGTTETHARATINGTLSVNGTLQLTNTDPSGTTLTDPITLPDTLNLKENTDYPTNLNLDEDIGFLGRFVMANLNMGIAIFLIGIMAIQLGATVALRNWAAGILWGLSVIILMFVGMFGLGLELYWMTVVIITIVLVAGMGVKWGRL